MKYTAEKTRQVELADVEQRIRLLMNACPEIGVAVLEDRSDEEATAIVRQRLHYLRDHLDRDV